MMHGHHELIEMRQQRKKPGIVFLNDYPCETDWHKWRGESVTVCTDGEELQTIDLRFLVGLKVSISSTVEQRAKQLFDLVKSSGAAVVAVCHIKPHEPAHKQTGWSSIWQKAGVNHG